MGVYHRAPHPERLPAMARLRAADAPFAMAVDRQWERRRNTAYRRVLDLEGAYVHHKLCPGGLGDL